MSEEANQAEQEERIQLENWVGGIERLVSQREEESNVELEKQRELIERLKSERDHLEKQIQAVSRSTDKASASSSATEEMLSSLREQNEKLQAELSDSQSDAEALRRKTEHNDGVDSEQFVEMQDKLRALEIELSQERASIARERVEITRLKDEMENRANAPNDDSDCRMQAMRQHLRELHEQESNERNRRSLGARISRLWSKLDNR